MLHYCFHPKEIPERDQRLIIKIMENGHVFSKIDDLLMNKAVYIFYLFNQVGKIFFIAIILQIDPYVLEKSGAFFYIQQLIKRNFIMLAKHSCFVQYKGSFTTNAPIGAITAMFLKGNALT